MFSYDDQFNTARGLIEYYIKLCEHYSLKYTHKTDKALPPDLQELKTIILRAMEQANFTKREHLYQIMWFAKIPDQEVLRTLLNGLLNALTEPLQQSHILQAYVFAFQQSDKTLLETLSPDDLLKPMLDLMEACAEIIAQDKISYLNTALTELNLLFDEMVKRDIKLSDQYKNQLKQLMDTYEEVIKDERKTRKKDGKQTKFYELSDKINYTKVALTAIPSYLTKEEKGKLAFKTIAVGSNALELVAAGLAVPVTLGLSSIIFKDVGRLAKRVRNKQSKAYPSLTKTTEWYGFVQEVRQLIVLNALTEKQVPDITEDEIKQLWVDFEKSLFTVIGEDDERIYFNISLLPGLVHVVESLSNLILLGNRAESLALSIPSQKKIVSLLVSIYHMKEKKSGLGRLSIGSTNKDLIANLKDRIRIYLQTFARLPAQAHVISKKDVQVLAISVSNKQQVTDEVTLLLNRFKAGQDSLLFSSNLVHQAWEQSLSHSFVYFKLWFHSCKEIAKAIPAGQSVVKQKELYINPKCRESYRENSDSYDLRVRFDTFLVASNKQRVLWLLGDPGSGKTLAAHKITKQLLDEYEPGKHLPVLITLPNVSKPMRCLRMLFNEILLGHSQYLKVMNEIRADQNQPLVFIFEAYDEVFMNDSFDVYSGATEKSNHLEEWSNIKVLITVRTNYRPDELSFKRLLQNCPLEQQVIVYLESFQESNIQWYLERFLTVKEREKPENSRLDGLMRKIMQPSIRTLARNPLFLSCLVEESALLDEEMAQSIRVSLYDRLLEQWFIRTKGKLNDNTLTLDVIAVFVKELAFRMFKQETVTAPDLTHRTEFLKFWNSKDPAIRNLFDNSNFEKLLYGSPLKQVTQLPEDQVFQGNQDQAQQLRAADQHKGYRFIHDTFRTYYLARYLFDQLVCDAQATKICKEISINEYATSSRNTGIMQTPNSNEVVDSLVELIEYSRSKSEIVRKLDFLLKEGSAHAKAWSLSVLAKGEFISFYHKDLSGISAPYAELRGCDFQYTNFSGSVLNHVDLSGAYIGGSNFSDVSLKGATISSLGHVDLSCYSLKGATSSLGHTDLSGASLEGVTVSSLGHVDLSCSSLKRVTISALGSVDLSDASLEDVTISIKSPEYVAISANSPAYYPIKVVIDDEKKWLVSYNSNNELAMRELATGKLVSTRAFRDNITDIALVNKTHEIAVLTSRGESKRKGLYFYQLSESNELVVSSQQPERLSSKATTLISLPNVEALCWSRRNELVYYNLSNRTKLVHKVASNSKVTVRKIVTHWQRLAWWLSDNRVVVCKYNNLLTVAPSQEIKAMLLLNKKGDSIKDIALYTMGERQLRVLMAKEQRIIIVNIQFDETGKVVGQSLQRIESMAMYLACCGFDYVIWACSYGSDPTAEQRRRSNMLFRKLDIGFAIKHDYDHDPDSTALLGHSEAVTDMKAYEIGDEQVLVSAGEDGVIHRWEFDKEYNSWKLIWRSGVGLHARGCNIEGAKLSEENGEKLKMLGAIGQYERVLDAQAKSRVIEVLLPSEQIGKGASLDIYSPCPPIELDFDY